MTSTAARRSVGVQRTVNQTADALRLGRTVIVLKSQFRNMPNLDLATQLAAQKTAGSFESFLHRLRISVRVQQAEIHARDAQVPRQVDRRQRHSFSRGSLVSKRTNSFSVRST